MTTQKCHPVRNLRQGEGGFTLIELMVVVAIIAILAAIGIPKMTAFVETAKTAEAVEQVGRISKAIRGYIDSHPGDSTSDALLATAIATTFPYLSSPAVSGKSITTIIPVLTIAENATFSYKILAFSLDTNRNVRLCIQAVPDPGATAPADTLFGSTIKKSVFYSETLPTGSGVSEVWEGRIFRAGYIDGTTALVAGGDCPTIS